MSQTSTAQQPLSAAEMKMTDLSFEQLMEIYNHIGDEERHFNNLEMEYRKLASQWLLVSIGAIGFILSKDELVPFNVWILVMAICTAASMGILVIWLLDLKVYHELLHGAFKEGVALENQFKDVLPKIRKNMLDSQKGGDIIRSVILFYFFSVMLLVTIANIAVWMFRPENFALCLSVNFLSLIVLAGVYWMMKPKKDREFKKGKA